MLALLKCCFFRFRMFATLVCTEKMLNVHSVQRAFGRKILKGTWIWGGFSGVFAEIGSSWVPYTIYTFRAVPILAWNSRRYSRSRRLPNLASWGVWESANGFLKEKSPRQWVTDSLSQWVTHSPTRLVGEWMSDKNSRIGKKYLCVPVVAGIPCSSCVRCLWYCWRSVVGIPALALSMLLPTPLPCWYSCGYL